MQQGVIRYKHSFIDNLYLYIMFGLFKKKDEVSLLQQKYEQLMLEARNIQRAGDMRAFALKTAEAEKVMDQIVALKNGKK